MQLALTLLISAQTLLAMVLGNPNLPQDFKDNAVSIANNAIVVAQEEIAKQTTQPTVQTTPTVTQPIQQAPVQTLTSPSFGSTINVMDKSEIKANVTFTDNKDIDNGIPFGSYFIKVELIDTSGNNVEMGEITMTTPEGTETRKMDSHTRENPNAWYHTFTYIPKSSGDKSITFSGSNLTKTITINVK